MQREYVATLRLGYKAADEIEAQLIADSVVTEAMKILESEDGDEAVITQVTDYAPADIPAEAINVLIKARNTLIKAKLHHTVEAARELDKIIFALEHGDWIALAPYDYGRFVDVMTAIFAGKAPA